MPRLIVLEAAQEDLKRLVRFLKNKNGEAAERLKRLVNTSLKNLRASPHLGSPYREYKRKIIKFGQSKYILVYFLDVMADELYVVAIYHGKEDPTHPEHGDYDDASGFDDD